MPFLNHEHFFLRSCITEVQGPTYVTRYTMSKIFMYNIFLKYFNDVVLLPVEEILRSVKIKHT